VHLIVQKPYRLGWKHLPGADRVELSVSAETTAGEVAAELEVGALITTLGLVIYLYGSALLLQPATSKSDHFARCVSPHDLNLCTMQQTSL
jgi:hypothetical protein